MLFSVTAVDESVGNQEAENDADDTTQNGHFKLKNTGKQFGLNLLNNDKRNNYSESDL